MNFSDPFGLCPVWLDGIPCENALDSPMEAASANTGSGVQGSEFGMTRKTVTGEPKGHCGFDWAGPVGTPARAAGGGVVTLGSDPESGNYAYLKMDNGASISISHLQDYSPLQQSSWSAGESFRIEAGTVLGYVGSSGNAAYSGREPHGHVRTKVGGRDINPRSFFADQPGPAEKCEP